MGYLQVLFEVPRYIEYGLATGTLQRVGGVIVETSSKQIVAWLRDGSLLETGLRTAASALNPLNLVMQAGQIAGSLIDGHLTRNAIGELGKQVAANHAETMQVLGALGQSVQTIGTLTMLTASGQLLNLALTGVTFRTIIRRLDKLSESIDQLGQKISAEFNRERHIRFQVALQAARDAFESQHEANRQSKAHDAMLGLHEACEHFFFELDGLLKGKLNRDQLLLAQHLLTRAMYAETSRIRCYMLSGDVDLARMRLKEDMPKFDHYTKTLINRWLGEHPAVYFHKDVPEGYLSRFFYIQQWLRGVDSGNDAFTMFQIINDLRPDFWDNTVVDGNVVGAIKRRAGILAARRKEDQNSELDKGLLQSELLIENYERLIGFEMEIQSIRLEFEEWSRLVTEEDLEEHGGALIVDDEIAERYARLSL